MEDRKKTTIRGWTGLAKHGHTVSLAPARAVSSHARRLYGSRYAGRYRYARLIFAFDFLLLGVVAVLGVFNLSLLYQRYVSLPPGLELAFEAASITASDVLPLQLTVKSTDGKRHDGVMLHWNLPPWVEILDAYPPLASDKGVDLGTIKPGAEKKSRLMAKVRGKVGEKVQFGFSVTQYDPLLFALTYSGSEIRTVENAALSVRAAIANADYQTGASVPFIIENAGSGVAQAITLRLVSHEGVADARLGKEGNYSLGDLNPGEKRVVFVDLGESMSDAFKLNLELQDAAQVVQEYALGAQSVPKCGLEVSGIATDAGGFRLDYGTRGKARLLAVGGPLAGGLEPYRIIELDQASGTYRHEAPQGQQGGSWDIVPVDLSVARPCVGLRQTAAAKDSLPVTAEARYFAATGDQLGVGPLPPVVGEKTTYWIIWSIGPFSSDLKDARLNARLAPNVAATGKYSSTVSGDFSFADGTVEWTSAELKIAGTQNINLAFEVALVPQAEQAGSAAPLLGETRVTALTGQGNILDVGLPGVDTDLETDAKAQGKGSVEKR